MRRAPLLFVLLCACSDPAPLTSDGGRDGGAPLDAARADASSDAGTTADARADAAAMPDVGSPDATASMDATSDAGSPDAAPADAGSTCTRPLGQRFSAGDECNFCECQPDGSTVCTTRVCQVSIGGCEYGGTMHGYGERFPSADACNECVCAASGLACTTRRGCTDVPMSAILLESTDTPCGADPTFTAGHVLATLPVTDLTAPFLYDRARPANQYPERLPDTNVRVRIVYDRGFLVCRLPSEDQPALDIEIAMEWITEDGALDEGFPAYLRRNNFGFVDAWQVLASQPYGGLHGTYVPNCAIDPGGYTFAAEIEPNGHATGAMHRVCESDLSLVVGTFDRPAP